MKSLVDNRWEMVSKLIQFIVFGILLKIVGFLPY